MNFELAKSYEPSAVEAKWQQFWEENKCFFVDNPLEADFSIAFPPPNVTGELHMGHALNGTLQDVLIRYHRMLGKKVHWQIGSDHAGIGTQIVVEKQLAKEGKTKYDLGRNEFEKRVWEWTNKYRGRIEEQMSLLGFSPDMSKSEFTLNPNYVQAVRKHFFELFKEGLIYQGTRLINWCPHCLTSLSDLEVIHEDRTGNLYKIKYSLVTPCNGEQLTELIVATSRPETLFGDVAVAINPNDERYKALSDRIKEGETHYVRLPLTNKNIPIILSEAVQLDFGTGALKITPAHDFNDSQITNDWNNDPASQFKLPLEASIEEVNIFDEKACLLPLKHIPDELRGMERFKAREKTLQLLAEQELLLEEEKYSTAAALHDRCGTVIEPYLSKQWFVNMKPLAKLAIDALTPPAPLTVGDNIKFHPERYSKTYLDWLENIQDWCISRQLWWGHQIPVWSKKLDPLALNDSSKATEMHEQIIKEFKHFSKEAGFTQKPSLRGDAHHPSFVLGSKQDNEYIFQYGTENAQIVLLNTDELFEAKLKEYGYEQDPDVLDTWFSSALWPFAAQGWPSENTPSTALGRGAGEPKPWTNVLITAREIINLWVSRMIYSSQKLTDRLPFTDILIHPVIQTPDGKRMSKSKGNAIDPIDLVNKYGADASRLWYCSVGIYANQDTRFSGRKEKDGTWTSPELENKRRFINKLWNASKFVLQNTINQASEDGDSTNSKSFLEESLSISEVIQKVIDSSGKNKTANVWILGRLNEVLKESYGHLNNYRFAEYSRCLEDFVWNDFCDWYLELAKLASPPNPLDRGNKQVLFYVLENILRALNPIIPHATEELWQALTGKTESLCKQQYPEAVELDDELSAKYGDALARINMLKTLTKTIRSIRQKILGLSPSFKLNAAITIKNKNSNETLNYKNIFDLTKLELMKLIGLEESPIDESAKRIKKNFSLTGADFTFVNVTIEIQVPDAVELTSRKEVLKPDLKKKLDKKTKTEARYNNPGFLKNASDEIKSELQQNIKLLKQEIDELVEGLKQIEEAQRTGGLKG